MVASATPPSRRATWTEAATDYVLEHGLIGLSLRPLAAHLGTSDRMLLYHFGSKDELVADLLRTANDRAVAQVAALPCLSGLGEAVRLLWEATRDGATERYTRIYIEAAALGLFGREPYASAVRRANERWFDTLVTWFARVGIDRDLATRVADIVDAAFIGFQLNQPLDTRPDRRARMVDDLAASVEALARSHDSGSALDSGTGPQAS